LKLATFPAAPRSSAIPDRTEANVEDAIAVLRTSEHGRKVFRPVLDLFELATRLDTKEQYATLTLLIAFCSGIPITTREYVRAVIDNKSA